jgi:hypothetical protein
LNAKEAEIEALKASLNQGGAKQPAKGHSEALQGLIRRLATSEGPELYALRASLNAALRDIVDWIDFDANGDARLVMLRVDAAYRFTRDGTRYQKIALGLLTETMAAEKAA